MSQGLRRIFRYILVFVLLAVLLLGLARLVTYLYSIPRTFLLEKVPSRRIAIVFGAGLRRDGTPQPVLRDRIETAVQLYLHGKVEKLLMSGDNRTIYYNEPGAMKQYALDLGVPEKDIILDYAGRSTYETCYRARDIFKVDGAILVTQDFHLPRALYTCTQLGIDAVGVRADLRNYRKMSLLIWNLRETFATVNALWEVHISKPLPVLGDPEPIFSKETVDG